MLLPWHFSNIPELQCLLLNPGKNRLGVQNVKELHKSMREHAIFAINNELIQNGNSIHDFVNLTVAYFASHEMQTQSRHHLHFLFFLVLDAFPTLSFVVQIWSFLCHRCWEEQKVYYSGIWGKEEDLTIKCTFALEIAHLKILGWKWLQILFVDSLYKPMKDIPWKSYWWLQYHEVQSTTKPLFYGSSTICPKHPFQLWCLM